jgi:riboflavin synthase
MFTGIITDVGEIIELEKRGDLRARIKTNYDAKGIAFGASIACDGICLTAVDFGDNWFDVDISAETVSKTIIGSGLWEINYKVNLERSLKVGDELGGHIVSGHVDGIATVSSIVDEGDSTRFTFEAPMELARFIAPKGSVALNGTSLTVNEVKENAFGINLVPHTKKVTSWNKTQVGDPINLEIDTLARYVARLAEYQ